MTRRRIVFSGRVQGVGFRQTARHVAANCVVTGYVRNLDDGRVELVMEGSGEELDAVLAGITREMGPYIIRTTSDVSPGTGEFEDFRIRY